MNDSRKIGTDNTDGDNLDWNSYFRLLCDNQSVTISYFTIRGSQNYANIQYLSHTLWVGETHMGCSSVNLYPSIPLGQCITPNSSSMSLQGLTLLSSGSWLLLPPAQHPTTLSRSQFCSFTCEFFNCKRSSDISSTFSLHTALSTTGSPFSLSLASAT